jgi:TonB family protein
MRAWQLYGAILATAMAMASEAQHSAAAQSPPSNPVPNPPLATPDYPLPTFPQTANLPQPEKSPSPKDNPARWVNIDEYPSYALAYKLQGKVRFSLAVGKDGRPEACSILASSGVRMLDEATCDQMLRRARFTPATDAQGNPAEGSYANTVVWRYPEKAKNDIIGMAPNPIIAPASWVTQADYGGANVPAGSLMRLYYALSVTPTGKVSRCSHMKNKGLPAVPDAKAMRKICILLKSRARLNAARDNADKPVAAQFYTYVDWPV